MEYFNRSIKELFRLNPSNKTLTIIEDFRKRFGFKDYYQTLDSLGFKVGVEYLVQQVWDEERSCVHSYIPSLKLHTNNPLTGKFEIIELSEFKSINKAYGYTAKEQVYRLMEISNLEKFIA
jgi:hypothetical protein